MRPRSDAHMSMHRSIHMSAHRSIHRMIHMSTRMYRCLYTSIYSSLRTSRVRWCDTDAAVREYEEVELTDDVHQMVVPAAALRVPGRCGSTGPGPMRCFCGCRDGRGSRNGGRCCFSFECSCTNARPCRCDRAGAEQISKAVVHWHYLQDKGAVIVQPECNVQ